MILRVCAFTTEGWKLADKIEKDLPDCLMERKEEGISTDSFVKDSFERGLPVLFIGAMGIAVRLISPYVNSKLTDSPVVVIDEKGQYVIPVLSNHVGGANEIAGNISRAINATEVITTSTDVNNVFAIDVFAKKNGLKILNKDGIKLVSSKLLRGEKITVSVDPMIKLDESKIPGCIQIVDFNAKKSDVAICLPGSDTNIEASLILMFKPYIIGVGCKKETECDKFEKFISDTLSENNIDITLVSGMASIDLKRKEKCILYFEAKHRIPFNTYSAQELDETEGEFEESDFVKSVTGVSNVCERSAVKHAGEGATLIVRKTAKDGMTLAIAERKAKIQLWEM